MASTANRFIVANVSEGKNVETDNYETSALLVLFYISFLKAQSPPWPSVYQLLGLVSSSTSTTSKWDSQLHHGVLL
jgi:hypothetical protein